MIELESKLSMSQLKLSNSSLRGRLAAISPYSRIFKQPTPPSSGQIHAAVYLFRHGILEVSHHDYAEYIAPFLAKLRSLQRASHPFVTGRLSFLSFYQSWITEACGNGFRRRLQAEFRPGQSISCQIQAVVNPYAWLSESYTGRLDRLCNPLPALCSDLCRRICWYIRYLLVLDFFGLY
jgi:hypothetical protein